MKIYVLHNDYGAFSGEERMVEYIAVLLQNGGHDVLKRRVPGIRQRTVKDYLLAAYWSIFGDRNTLKHVTQEVEDFAPDVVLIQNVFPRISSKIVEVLKLLNIPVVMRQANYRLVCPVGTALRSGSVCVDCEFLGVSRAVFHNCGGSIFKSLVYAARHRIHSRALRSFNSFIAQTTYQGRVLERVAGLQGRVSVIGNVVQGHIAEPHALAKWKQSNPNKVAFVGRRSEEKGYDVFVSVAEHLESFEFHSIGRPVRDWNKQLANLENHIDHGFIANDRVCEVLAACHFVLVPSKWPEGMPNVILEAFSAGTVVLVPSVGALPEVVGFGKYGAIVNAADSAAFEKGLTFLWRRPQLCMRIAGRAFKHVGLQHGEAEFLGAMNRVLSAARRKCG